MSLYTYPTQDTWKDWGKQLTENARLFPDQRGNLEQLRDLWEIARRLRMYDAADYLKGIIDPLTKPEPVAYDKV